MNLSLAIQTKQSEKKSDESIRALLFQAGIRDSQKRAGYMPKQMPVDDISVQYSFLTGEKKIIYPRRYIPMFVTQWRCMAEASLLSSKYRSQLYAIAIFMRQMGWATPSYQLFQHSSFDFLCVGLDDNDDDDVIFKKLPDENEIIIGLKKLPDEISVQCDLSGHWDITAYGMEDLIDSL